MGRGGFFRRVRAVVVMALPAVAWGEVIVNQSAGRTGPFIGSQQAADVPTFTQAAFDDFTIARAYELGALVVYGRGTGSGADNTAVVAAVHASPDLNTAAVVTVGGFQIGTDLFFDFGGATLPAGRYWITAYVVRLNSRGTWQWALRRPVEGAQAMWHNPGAGFGRGATPIRLGDLLEEGDLAFILTGNVSVARPPAPAILSAFLNLSMRTPMTPGQTVSAGFVIGGTTRRRVLVRAVGPGLAGFGVPNVVTAPSLAVYSAQSPLAANTGWGGGPALTELFASVGAFALPVSSRDAALVLALDPGAYTVQVRGDNAGEVLVEVYLVD